MLVAFAYLNASTQRCLEHESGRELLNMDSRDFVRGVYLNISDDFEGKVCRRHIA